VKIANDTPDRIEGLSASMSVYDLAGRLLHHEEAGISADATSAADIFALPPRAAGAGTVFIKLQLKRDDHIVDDNFYWSNGPGAPCRDLETLPKVALVAAATMAADGCTIRINVTMANPTVSVALMARLKVSRGTSGARVLPVFYEDNYISLLPGEKRSVSLTFATADLAGEAPRLTVEGWNIVPAEVILR
jgi:beta-mannosidase